MKLTYFDPILSSFMNNCLFFQMQNKVLMKIIVDYLLSIPLPRRARSPWQLQFRVSCVGVWVGAWLLNFVWTE